MIPKLGAMLWSIVLSFQMPKAGSPWTGHGNFLTTPVVPVFACSRRGTDNFSVHARVLYARHNCHCFAKTGAGQDGGWPTPDRSDAPRSAAAAYRACWIADSSQIPPGARMKVQSSVARLRTVRLPSTTRPTASRVASSIEKRIATVA